MPEFKPFRGIRYSASAEMKDLACPPYDIISPQEQDELHERHPHNAVRLELAKQAGPDGYAKVADLFASWLADGILEQDGEPSFYVYRQDLTGPDGDRRRIIGTIGALGLEEFGSDAGVLPHERTMPGPIEDRLALLDALQVNVSPIYAIYRGGGALEPFYTDLENRPTEARFADAGQVLHRLWKVTAPAEIEMLAANVSSHTLVIADGHHRYETALTYHRANEGKPGEHDSIMCFCVDADVAGLVVLPYNRALRASEDVHEALAAVAATPAGDPEEALRTSASDHPFVFVTEQGEMLVEVPDAEVVEAVGERAEAWRALDVVALHEALLPKMFPSGVKEFRFSKDPDEIRRLVSEEGWTAGVLLKALDAAQIVDVARSGERMPQKASYFWPKAVTGLVFRSLS
ncbi:MAG: DUF1015 family protein [Actinomycetota bacterium]